MFFSEEHKLLREILEVLKRIEHKLEQKPNVVSFTIKETSMQPLAPGFSPQYTATPQPAGVVLNPALPVPAWTSSDTTNAPITVDPTGLIATVAIPTSATVGTSVTLTINYTNGDGTTATGSTTFTIVAAPPADVTSFTIAQTQ